MVVVVVVGSIQFFVVVGFTATCFSKPPERGENESANKIVLYDTIISLPYSVGQMQIIGYTPIQGEGITQEHECQKVEFIAAALMAVYHRLQLKFF